MNTSLGFRVWGLGYVWGLGFQWELWKGLVLRAFGRGYTGGFCSRCPSSTLFSFWVPLLKPNSRKKGALIIKGLLGNLVYIYIVF